MTTTRPRVLPATYFCLSAHCGGPFMQNSWRTRSHCQGETLALSRADGTHKTVINFYRRIDLLLLDDYGLSPVPIAASRELLEILD